MKAKGTIYLSNVRMVFVASKPAGNFYAFDMPLVCKLFPFVHCFCHIFPLQLSQKTLHEPTFCMYQHFLIYNLSGLTVIGIVLSFQVPSHSPLSHPLNLTCGHA